MTVTVAALYRFATFDDPAALRGPLLSLCEEKGIKGTLLLASEGINGTIAGEPSGVEAVVAHIRGLPGCADLDVKYSASSAPPFGRMKVRLKREIVTMRVPGIDAAREAGTHVPPDEWNALISDPEVIVIDTRNDYEVALGSFPGAIDPKTRSFADFPGWFRAERERIGKDARVAMFCTGGIRCEKATAFVKAEGVGEVFHLEGGILRYLENVPESESLWQGECYVFDERVSVGQGLVPGKHAMCGACGRPVVAGEECKVCGSGDM